MNPSSDNLKRKNLLLKAKLAEEAKRYDHMVFFMMKIVETTNPATDLSPKEHCLLGAAFKNFVAHPRDAWRSLSSSTQSSRDDLATAAYLLKTKTEISNACTEVVQLIDRRLFPSAISNESKVFYLTLKGDFSWYSAEVKGELEGMEDAGVANAAYFDAMMIAGRLESMNPYRLALDLSIAEHFYHFLHLPAGATITVDRALKVALIGLETRPAVSLLSFEGGLQLLANLTMLKQRLHKQQQSDAAGTSKCPAGDVAGDP